MVYDGYIIRFIKDICTVHCWSLIKYKIFHIYSCGIFMVIFLGHDGYFFHNIMIVCCETDSGFKVLANDVG